MTFLKSLSAAALCAALALPVSAHVFEIEGSDENHTITSLAEALNELAERQAEDARIAANLETFRRLDLDVFSNNQIERFDESHAQDVVVYYPDGRVTQGLDQHIEDVRWFFAWAPDTHISHHVTRFGQGKWTGSIGILKGTFTEPMPMFDGSMADPTGNAYEIRFATISHWNDEGRMDEEYLFWDNDNFFRQLGLRE